MMTEELLALLKLFEASTRPLTARRIADKTKTYQATAKRRVEALQVELKKERRSSARSTARASGGRRARRGCWSSEDHRVRSV